MNARGIRRRAAVAAVALVGLPFALTGCGASAGTTGSASTNKCPAAPGVTPSSVKIGLIYPDTGAAQVAAAFQAARGAANARIQAQNAQGGVNGRTIDLVWGDDQSSPQTFAKVAHDLIDQQGVFGLVTTTIAINDSFGWLAQQNIPVTGVATSQLWSDAKYPNVFHFGNIYNGGSVTTFGQFAKAQGGTKAIILTDPSEAASQTLVSEFAPSLSSQGIRIVGTLDYTDNVSSPARAAQQIRDAGVDTVVGAAQLNSFLDILAATKRLGVNLKVALNATGYIPDLLRTRGDEMVGMSIMLGYALIGSPAMNAYENTMKKYSPELGNPTDELALASYVATDEMIKGIELAGPCPTRESFIKNLRQATYNAGGMIPPVKLADRTAPSACYNFAKVEATASGPQFKQVPGGQADGSWCGTVVTNQ